MQHPCLIKPGVSSIAVYGTHTKHLTRSKKLCPLLQQQCHTLSPPPFLFMSSSSSALLSIHQFHPFLQTFAANCSSFCINGTVHAKNTRDRAYASNAMRRAYPSPPLLPAPPLSLLICLAVPRFRCSGSLSLPFAIQLT